jgi:spermidine/putrescine transport system ATP-binding protein
MSSPIIEIDNVQKFYSAFHALTDINLTVQAGEIVTLLGPSGCGKTSLMRVVAGFTDPSSGTLKIDGVDMKHVSPEHRPVNMVFQRYALFPHLDVFDNVAYGLRAKRLPKDEVLKRTKSMLDIVQLGDLSHRLIHELSGGQCQRVALARALVNRPKVLLLDEPLAALDLKIRQHMLREMKRIHSETGATFVYVTHDQEEAMILSDRVVLLDKGKIIQVGEPKELYHRPNSLFAAKFLGEINLFHGTVVAGDQSPSVRTDEGLSFDAGVDLKLGSKAVVAIRPEALSFDGDYGPDGQSVEGVVTEVVFTGSRSYFVLRTAFGADIRVQATDQPGKPGPVLGDKVPVKWHRGSVRILRPQA